MCDVIKAQNINHVACTTKFTVCPPKKTTVKEFKQNKKERAEEVRYTRKKKGNGQEGATYNNSKARQRRLKSII